MCFVRKNKTSHEPLGARSKKRAATFVTVCEAPPTPLYRNQHDAIIIPSLSPTINISVKLECWSEGTVQCSSYRGLPVTKTI